MSADVNKTNMEDSINYSTPIIRSSNTINNITSSSNVEQMDITNFPPLDDHLQNLHNRGVSIHVSNNMPSKQQQHQHGLQLLDQRSTAYQQLVQQQQHKSKQNQISDKQLQKVQPSKQKVTSKQIKKTSKRKKSAILSSAESDSDVSAQPLTHTPLSSNRFALLSELNISSMVERNVQTTENSSNVNDVTQNTTYTSHNQAHTSQNDVANRSNSRATKFCPPIVLYNIDINNLVSQFKTSFTDLEIKIVNKTKNKSKLYVKDIQAYSTIMNILKEKLVRTLLRRLRTGRLL